MNEVKDRIIEYISVLKLRKDSKRGLLFFGGTSWRGKNFYWGSYCKGFAYQVFRFSVGGMLMSRRLRDTEELMLVLCLEKIIQGLRITKTNSPVFLIDEVDKISASSYGDPFRFFLRF